ncbi:alpha/beta hydrolase, partial [Myxococcota bacterium]|nr:alpha/beta hydrolase [Myxococcota bacterium]
MKTLSLSTLGILLVAYIVIGALLFLSQRKFIYFPTSAIKHGYPEEIFKTGTESIVVAVVNGGREKALLYFGGNAEEVIYNAPDFAKIFAEHTVYLVNYRGYGGSSGQPTEAG